MANERQDDLLEHPDVAAALSLERAEGAVVCQRCGQRKAQSWTLTLSDEGDATIHAYDVCSDCAALFTRSLTYHSAGRG